MTESHIIKMSILRSSECCCLITVLVPPPTCPQPTHINSINSAPYIRTQTKPYIWSAFVSSYPPPIECSRIPSPFRSKVRFPLSSIHDIWSQPSYLEPLSTLHSWPVIVLPKSSIVSLWGRGPFGLMNIYVFCWKLLWNYKPSKKEFCIWMMNNLVDVYILCKMYEKVCSHVYIFVFVFVFVTKGAILLKYSVKYSCPLHFMTT